MLFESHVLCLPLLLKCACSVLFFVSTVLCVSVCLLSVVFYLAPSYAFV